jgi:hypothetical protein
VGAHLLLLDYLILLQNLFLLVVDSLLDILKHRLGRDVQTLDLEKQIKSNQIFLKLLKQWTSNIT